MGNPQINSFQMLIGNLRGPDFGRLAKQVTTDGHRKTLEEMAEAWRIVAAEADKKH
jgi:hypothetical protein